MTRAEWERWLDDHPGGTVALTFALGIVIAAATVAIVVLLAYRL